MNKLDKWASLHGWLCFEIHRMETDRDPHHNAYRICHFKAVLGRMAIIDAVYACQSLTEAGY